MAARFALRILLAMLGRLMRLACWARPSFRAAISAPRTILVETSDGVAHHYAFGDRRVASRSGVPEAWDFRLCFRSSSQALGMLTSPRSVGRILNGILDRSVVAEGSLVLLLWFDGRVQAVAPLREPFRRPARLPDACLEPTDEFDCVRREPVTEVLDADWTAAWEQRRRLVMMRIAAGEPFFEV